MRRGWFHRSSLACGLLGLAACGALSAACGTSHHAGGASHTETVAVSLQDFKIDVPTVIHAGRIRFRVTGVGPTMHEFNVARTDLAPEKLPVGADGNVDDTEPHPGFTHLGEVEGIDIGQHKTLTVTLSPGNYVAYCNMDGHYMADMVARVTVVP